MTEFLERDQNVLFAVLFGSVAKGRAGRGSDMDIAVYFRKPPAGVEILDYTRELSERAGREVHLAILNTASALLRHQVMKYGRPLVIKDRREYTRFRERTITDYQEY
ncbi:MAG: nucleotidyltransferase domain-containing protein, partial [Nitrospirae bacterium]|nr:nucleotidyltransferase domain-containing protein [Nitrospirota bacterium]